MTCEESVEFSIKFNEDEKAALQIENEKLKERVRELELEVAMLENQIQHCE